MIRLAISTLCLALLAAFAVGPAVMVAASSQEAAAADPERDPTCGMTVDPAKAKAAGRTSQYEGTTYYFCADSCKKQFDADPAKYVRKKADGKTESSQATMSGGCCRRTADAAPKSHCCGQGMHSMPH
jgi:Cu+-exporting ATPase